MKDKLYADTHDSGDEMAKGQLRSNREKKKPKADKNKRKGMPAASPFRSTLPIRKRLQRQKVVIAVRAGWPPSGIAANFRYSSRVKLGVDGDERAARALKCIVGKRLIYRAADN